eukprot:COSAG05_NODE_8927_length_660_cov_2.484848_1_plen_89_part_00
MKKSIYTQRIEPCALGQSTVLSHRAILQLIKKAGKVFGELSDDTPLGEISADTLSLVCYYTKSRLSGHIDELRRKGPHAHYIWLYRGA